MKYSFKLVHLAQWFSGSHTKSTMKFSPKEKGKIKGYGYFFQKLDLSTLIDCWSKMVRLCLTFFEWLFLVLKCSLFYEKVIGDGGSFKKCQVGKKMLVPYECLKYYSSMKSQYLEGASHILAYFLRGSGSGIQERQ